MWNMRKSFNVENVQDEIPWEFTVGGSPSVGRGCNKIGEKVSSTLLFLLKLVSIVIEEKVDLS